MFFRDWQWYFLINNTKRFIGQKSVEDQLAELEAEAALHCTEFDKEVAIRDDCNAKKTSCWGGIGCKRAPFIALEGQRWVK